MIGPRVAEASWRHIDGLSYYLLYPALLFTAASQRAIEPGALLSIGLLACLIVTTGFLLSMGVKSLHREDSSQNRAGVSQNAWRFNTALGFVAVTALPAEASSVLAIAVGLAIPLANLYAVLAMTQGQAHSRYKLFKEVAFNPFLLASLAGVFAGLIGQPVPALIASFTGRLSDAAIPVVLLSLGAALRQTKLWPPSHYAVAISTIKLLVLPALVWCAVIISGTQGLVSATLLVFAALPTASAAHVLAARYGADRGQVAIAVMQSTSIGLLTLPLWTLLASRFVTV
jgi:predicted permease